MTLNTTLSNRVSLWTSIGWANSIHNIDTLQVSSSNYFNALTSCSDQLIFLHMRFPCIISPSSVLFPGKTAENSLLCINEILSSSPRVSQTPASGKRKGKTATILNSYANKAKPLQYQVMNMQPDQNFQSKNYSCDEVNPDSVLVKITLTYQLQSFSSQDKICNFYCISLL